MRRSFQALFLKAGIQARFELCGRRQKAYEDFCRALKSPFSDDEIYFLLVDSEDPISNRITETEEFWRHVADREGDKWTKPDFANQNHLLFMTTCTETWIMADSEAIDKIFKRDVQHSALFSPASLETRGRAEVLKALEHATRNCKASYEKGRHSCDLIEALNPQKLEKLSHWNRCVQILQEASAG